MTIARDKDSLALKMRWDQRAVGVPIEGSESMLRDVQPGDRLDVLASLPSPQDGRPVTAVVVRGATVLRPPGTSDPLLLEVPSDDALVLAHLVLGGTRLSYAVWPANGGVPPEPQPMDERTARSLLGLTVAPTPTEVPVVVGPATATPTPAAVPTPTQTSTSTAQPTSGFIYQVQHGDTWDSVAAAFKLPADELRRWNEVSPDAGLDTGTLLIVPRRSP